METTFIKGASEKIAVPDHADAHRWEAAHDAHADLLSNPSLKKRDARTDRRYIPDARSFSIIFCSAKDVTCTVCRHS